MEYTFTRDGVPEKVAVEKYGWGVIYKDGSEFKQFGEDGIFHQFKEINQSEVKMFVVYEIANPDKRWDILACGEAYQIFFYYKRMILAAGTDMETRPTVYVFGYKEKASGRSAYHFILPNGNLVLSDTEKVSMSQFPL